MPLPKSIANQQTVGNVGLFYVCYRLSRLGWNVMPTNRNARGVDILIYSQDLFADFVVVCRHVIRETPECFVLTPAEIRKRVHRGEKNGKISFWLQPRDYTTEEFREKWDRIGSGLIQ